MEITLLKVHGSGNTFYLYETTDEQQFDWSKLVSWLCDKTNENGADGLLIVCPSHVADAKMRVINADGSEASMCGNGLRCVARYVCEKLGVDEAIVETMKANLRVKKEQSLFKQLPTYSVEISPVSFALSSLPMRYKAQEVIMNEIIEEFSPTIQFTAVSVPNPHLIGIVKDDYTKCKSHQFLLARYLNAENEFCHDGVNVSYVYPMTSDSIFVRTYERGVGFTNACGTAMTAAALVAKLHHIVESRIITVYNPGGFVKCIINIEDECYRLLLVGNATVKSIYKLEIIGNNLKWLDSSQTNEQVEYEECIHFMEEQTKPFFY